MKNNKRGGKQPLNQAKLHKAEAAARKGLKPGETLIHYDCHKLLPFLGILLLFGSAFAFVGIMTPIIYIMGGSLIHFGGATETIVFTVFFLVTGMIFIYLWLFNYLASKNYYFVTDRRLYLGGRGFLGKPFNRDIPLASVVDVKGAAASNAAIVLTLDDNETYTLQPANMVAMIEAIKKAKDM